MNIIKTYALWKAIHTNVLSKCADIAERLWGNRRMSSASISYSSSFKYTMQYPLMISAWYGSRSSTFNCCRSNVHCTWGHPVHIMPLLILTGLTDSSGVRLSDTCRNFFLDTSELRIHAIFMVDKTWSLKLEGVGSKLNFQVCGLDSFFRVTPSQWGPGGVVAKITRRFKELFKVFFCPTKLPVPHMFGAEVPATYQYINHSSSMCHRVIINNKNKCDDLHSSSTGDVCIKKAGGLLIIIIYVFQDIEPKMLWAWRDKK